MGKNKQFNSRGKYLQEVFLIEKLPFLDTDTQLFSVLASNTFNSIYLFIFKFYLDNKLLIAFE